MSEEFSTQDRVDIAAIAGLLVMLVAFVFSAGAITALLIGHLVWQAGLIVAAAGLSVTLLMMLVDGREY